MEIKKEPLSYSEHFAIISELYFENATKNITHIAEKLAKVLNIPYTDSIRRGLSRYIRTNINNNTTPLSSNSKEQYKDKKILIFDIETGRIPAMVWWTGKTYITHTQLMEEPAIITIAWQWLGDDKVHHLTWDENHSDKKMMEGFLKVYNTAHMVIGQNNDAFDNKWINARAMRYGFDVNIHVKSFDIIKQTRKLFKLPSYSMAYITKFLGITQKVNHEGIVMWDKVQFGTQEEQAKYLKKMVQYNVGDIIATADMFLTFRKYMGHKVHFGVLNGGEKHSCPNCRGSNVELERTLVSSVGTISRVMKCLDDEVRYTLANTQYLKLLEFKELETNGE